MTQQVYKKYMLAYLDILGFKAKIEKSKEDQSEITKILQALENAQRFVAMINKRRPGGWGRPTNARLFSDTILVTIENPQFMSLSDITLIIMELQLRLIGYGHFLRGAVVIGDHYEHDDYLFGPAIITAYEMEGLAVWPRVLIHPSVMKDLQESHEVEPGLMDDINRYYVPRDKDGLRFINYLESTFLFYKAWKWALEYLGQPIDEFLQSDLLAGHRSAILAVLGMEEVCKDVRIAAKYHALAIYHNDVIERLCKSLPDPVEGEELKKNADSAQLYDHLKALFDAFYEHPSPEGAVGFFDSKIRELSKERDELMSKRIDNLQSLFPGIYEG